MRVYLPSEPVVAVAMATAVLLNLGWGLALSRGCHRHARWLSWVTAVIGIVATHLWLGNEPPGFRMLALIGIGLTSMKTIVVVEAQRGGMRRMSSRSWVAFAVGWLGMRPQCFVQHRRPDPRAAKTLATEGLSRGLLGAAVLAAAGWCMRSNTGSWVTTPLLLVGSSLVLHFGLCTILTAGWRWLGVSVDPIFRQPWRAESLSEFWSRRWNLAFSEMTSLAVYRPLSPRLGRTLALFVAFAFSALLHEMAISLPVDAGYGGPTVYFVLHGAAVALERALRRRGFVLRGVWGRVWTLAWLVAPLPLLFHRPFVEGILEPLISG